MRVQSAMEAPVRLHRRRSDGCVKTTFVTRLLRYVSSMIDSPLEKTDVMLPRMAT